MNEDNINKMNAAKLEAAMNKVFRFDCGVMSMKDFFSKNPPLFKKTYAEEYASKRTHLEYKKLAKPKITYAVFYDDRHCIDVPKMYYDSLINIPERE
jgi:hypothetical protein